MHSVYRKLRNIISTLRGTSKNKEIAICDRIYTEKFVVVNKSSLLSSILSVITIILMFITIFSLYDSPTPVINPDIESHWYKYNLSGSVTLGVNENKDIDSLPVRHCIINPSYSKFDIKVKNDFDVYVVNSSGDEMIVTGRAADGNTRADLRTIKPGEHFYYDVIIPLKYKDNGVRYEDGIYDIFIQNEYIQVENRNVFYTYLNGLFNPGNNIIETALEVEQRCSEETCMYEIKEIK